MASALAIGAGDNLLIINGEVNENCVLDGVSTISANGDLRVSVANFDACVAGGLAVSSLLVDPTQVVPGETIEMLWVSAGATSCTPGGTLPGWASEPIGLEGPVFFTVPGSATSGTYTAFVSCSANSGDPVVSTPVSIAVQQQQIDPPPAPSLTVTPSTVQQGGSVQVTWSSSNATSCTVPAAATNSLPGWSGSKAVSGSETVPISESLTAGSYTVRLQCQNGGGTSQTTSRTISVQQSVPSSCGPDQAPPATMDRAPTCLQNGSGDCTDYVQYFGGFPGTANLRFFVLQPNTYAALAFTPDATSIPPGASAAINVEALQTGGITAGQLLWSISDCPGDFNPATVQAATGDATCLYEGVFARFGFPFGGSNFTNDGTRCGLDLEPGKTYYLNITYTNDSPRSTPVSELEWICGTSDQEPCGHQMQVVSAIGWN
jgi:hypothetical protein